MGRNRNQERNEREKRKIQKVEITKVKLDSDFEEVQDEKGKYALIDGSSMEGGGQILRNSVSLSALLGKPVKIVNIRAKRDRPGLKAQHLTGIQLVKEMYKESSLVGATVNSMEIFFKAKNTMLDTAKEFVADTKTAGSIGLLIQVALPCAVFGPREITLQLRGGTNAEAAPQIDYTTHVFKPIAEQHFGFSFNVDIVKRGFYPQGGGIISLRCQPVQSVKPITLLQRGKIVDVKGRVFVSNLGTDIAERMAKSAGHVIKKHFTSVNQEPPIDFQIVQESKESAVGIGTGIIVIATTDTGCLIAGSALGERGKSAEKVGEEAANSLVENIVAGGCVDEYLQDQLILFMALAKGKSSVRTGPLTLHTQTSIHFAGHLTGAKFNVVPSKDEQSGVETFIVECEGIGYENVHISQSDVKN